MVVSTKHGSKVTRDPIISGGVLFSDVSAAIDDRRLDLQFHYKLAKW